jgi:hypothetical protein
MYIAELVALLERLPPDAQVIAVYACGTAEGEVVTAVLGSDGKTVELTVG